MPAKPITLGSLEFAKKGDAQEYFRGMLNKYDLGDKVTSKDGAELGLLLKRHPEADMKIGCGILSFSVRSADFGTKCFWVNRTDGSTEKFSFRSCIY